MDTKIQLLVVGDGGVKTGFARVLESIISNLPGDEYDVHHLAVNYKGDPYPTKSWHHMYPAHLGGDLIGLGRLTTMITKLKPDIIFMLNDLWLLKMYIDKMPVEYAPKTVVYFPVDGEYSDPVWVENFKKLAAVVAYTEFGAKEFSKIAPDVPVHVIPHGIDTETFFAADREEARAVLHIPKDKHNFIILNANRNQPRKRIDLTMQAFAEFVKDKPEGVALYLHMGTKDAGWDIVKLANRYGLKDRIVLSSLDLSPANFVPDKILNMIYNACEIGINTAMGEGWGLPSVEHAVTASAQVVPDASATRELFNDCGKLISIHDTYTYPEMLTVGKVISVPAAAHILDELYYDTKLRDSLGWEARMKFTSEQYQWSTIAKQWDAVFKQVVNANTVAGNTSS
jgi:D-inositol-3-phosphate glycosyltransferase